MRAIVIVGRLFPLFISILRDVRRWIWWGEPAVRTRRFHERRAQYLVNTVTALGPTFVKMAQIFAARADLIPEPYVSRLSTLQDQVKPVPTPKIRAEIERAFGSPIATLFERFDDTPIAAASLGQVHRACYQGEEIVVKVLRPGVEALVAKDLAVAVPLTRWLARRYPNPHLRNARTVIEEYSSKIGEEMDFVLEATYARRVRENFRGNPRVSVPRVIDALVALRVLGLEFMDGGRIDQVSARAGDAPFDPRGVVSAVLELYMQMMLIDGLFHADPHPGNLLVAPDGKVVLLDFGMVVEVPREMRWHLVSTVFAAIRRDTEGVIAGFESMGFVEPGADMAKIRELADMLMKLAYEKTTTMERIELLADQVMATMYDFPIRLPSEMVYFARTASLIEGLGTRFDPHFNAIMFASPIAMRMRSRIMASVSTEGGSSPVDMATVVGAALGHVAGLAVKAGKEWLGRLLAPSESGATSSGRVIPITAGRISAPDSHADASVLRLHGHEGRTLAAGD
ncbi:MAG: AarF/ABC1/UbiB kinase family protein [Gemmatimonadaceae bacterium]|nr:AarF/ABC1/UbiB kinase family protein [Gemmatimonadaceae bacterium]